MLRQTSLVWIILRRQDFDIGTDDVPVTEQVKELFLRQDFNPKKKKPKLSSQAVASDAILILGLRVGLT